MRVESIELDYFFPHPPERVWRALTDARLLARWLMPNDLRPRVGHRFFLDTGAWGRAECEVLEVDEGRLLRFAWRNEPLDTTVSWRLRPEGSGTRLTLVHDGFDPDDPRQRAALAGMSGGWPAILDTRLRACLEDLAESPTS